jgi:hypothetical protein
MKISLALGRRRPLDRTTAWGCLTANLAVPGCGSLVAGRPSGYLQLLLTVVGLSLTTFFGSKFIIWYLNNWSQFQQSQTEGEVAANLHELWIRLRWALLGMAVFLTAMLWALASSIGIIQESKNEESSAPPVLDGKRQ